MHVIKLRLEGNTIQARHSLQCTLSRQCWLVGQDPHRLCQAVDQVDFQATRKVNVAQQ